MTYDVIVTAVSDRADLFVRSMGTMLKYVDLAPSRILVHEDVRGDLRPVRVQRWLERCGFDYEHTVSFPPKGMGPAILWLLEQSKTPFVLYTQEDWEVVRRVPVQRTLELMQAHDIHHVRWNKRKTMPDKGKRKWKKVEVEFDGQKMCISDHWYTQMSLWRVSEALPAVQGVAHIRPDEHDKFVGHFNDQMNHKYAEPAAQDLQQVQGPIGQNVWHDQTLRHKYLRTYIWGPVGEPAFIQHTGHDRRTLNAD